MNRVLARLAVFLPLAFFLAQPSIAHAAGRVTSNPGVQPAATGPICYVDASKTGDGNSWTTAYADLQSALTDPNCSEIWVAKGVYKPTSNAASRSSSFYVRSGVAVYGGFNGTESTRGDRNPSVNITVLSGDIDNNDANHTTTNIDLTPADISGANSYHVVRMDGTGASTITASTVLDGFTVTGGESNGSSPDDRGAALYCDGHGTGHACSPTLANLSISGNTAFYGAGLYDNGIAGTSSPALTSVTFSGNSVTGSGGAIFNLAENGGVGSPTLTGVAFSGNSAVTAGGGMYDDAENGGTSSPSLSNVTFSGNQVTGSGGGGGGLTNDGTAGTSSPSLSNVTFSNNSAALGFGGGMQNLGPTSGQSNPHLTNVTFTGNSASRGGAMYDDGTSGLSSPVLSNVAFTGNSAGTNGGAIYDQGTAGASSPDISDTTFSSNSANLGGAMYNDGENKGQSNPSLTRVTFTGNSGALAAGAIYNNGEFGTSSPTFTDVIFSANHATGGVAGAMVNDGTNIGSVSSPVLVNTLFVGNKAEGNGGAVYNQGTNGGVSSPTLINVTFEGNIATGGRGGAILNDGSANGTSSLALHNGVLWGDSATNGGNEIYNLNNGLGTPTISYSDVQGSGGSGGSWNSALGTDGGGNRDTDPLFRNLSASDLRLEPNSPVANAGDNGAVPGGVTTDLVGNPRFFEDLAVPPTGKGFSPYVDMGAYENQFVCPVSTQIYVNGAASAGNNDGGSWANALTHLQTGLAIAKACGGPNELWVAKGIYKPTDNASDRSATFNVLPGQAVYGGFNGTESLRAARNPAANVTVLSGDIDNNDANAGTTGIDATPADIAGNNSLHVIRMDGTLGTAITGTTVLDGFTITGGEANGAFPNERGGGIYCDGSNGNPHACSPTLSQLTFSGNTGAYAGALYDNGLGGNSSPSLSDVTFSGNSASPGSGGAIWNLGEQSGVASPILSRVTFNGNTAGQGGAMYNDGNQGTSSPTLTDVTFYGNNAAFGGALVNDASTFGLSQAAMTNVTFAGNTATNVGGAMANIGSIGGAAGATLTNAILWGDSAVNGGNEISDSNYVPSIDHSVVQGGCASIAGATCGAGDLSTNPVLAALANNGGYTQTMALPSGSPAIDAGTNTGCPALDQRDIPRWQGLRCDIGAYETIDPTVERVSPADGAQACLTPSIGLRVRLNALMLSAGAFDPSKVTLTMDGSDILSPAAISQSEDFPASLASLTYTPPSSLSAGTHQVIFTYPTATGTMQRVWDFTAAAITCTAAVPELPSLTGPTIITPINPQFPTSRSRISP